MSYGTTCSYFRQASTKQEAAHLGDRRVLLLNPANLQYWVRPSLGWTEAQCRARCRIRRNRWWLIFLIQLCQYNSVTRSWPLSIPISLFLIIFFSPWSLVFSGLSTGCQGIAAWKAKDPHRAAALILLLVQDIFCLCFSLVTKMN